MAPPPLRGPSSRQMLDINWTYPSYTPVARKSSGDTVSVEAKRALPLDQVYAILAADDPRPLLVLRECLTCTGTDDALLSKTGDNEKTMLMSQWFHCVKVPPSVLEEDHAFHGLFAGKDPSHLFVSRPDGSERMDLNGQQSRTELWSVMEKLLNVEYSKKYEAALKQLLSILDSFDGIDDKIAEVEGRMNDAIEDDGPDSRKVKKLRKELTRLRAEKADLRERAVEVAKLPLKKAKKA